ncbi:MAG: toxin-antitoxin system HicB family antitoxin [Acidobacteriota bacterium]
MNRDKFDLNAYPFQIRPLSREDGGGFLIEYQDIPGCASDGKTPEEAIENAWDAVRSCLRTVREFGDPILRPSSFSASSGQWLRRVPKSLHARLVARAAQEGVSLNTLVTSLLAQGFAGRRSRAS